MSENPTFTGNAEQRALAEQIFQVMKTQGTFFAADAPIRQTLDNLADFFAAQRKADRGKVAKEIEAALNKNETIFAREQHGDDVSYVISRLGSYRPRNDENTHMFKQRLYEPDNPLPVDDISVVVTTTRPALTTVEPVFISDYWQQQAGLTPIVPSYDTEALLIEETAPVEAAAEMVEEVAPVVEAEEQEAPAVATAAEKPTAATTGIQNTMITLPNGVQIDLRRPVADLIGQYGPSLLAQFRAALDNDPLRRIVTFGNDAFPEAAVENFGKNDLRRIRDYLIETGEPMSDTQIIADIFYHNPRQTDYETFRFALDYRLGSGRQKVCRRLAPSA